MAHDKRSGELIPSWKLLRNAQIRIDIWKPNSYISHCFSFLIIRSLSFHLFLFNQDIVSLMSFDSLSQEDLSIFDRQAERGTNRDLLKYFSHFQKSKDRFFFAKLYSLVMNSSLSELSFVITQRSSSSYKVRESVLWIMQGSLLPCLHCCQVEIMLLKFLAGYLFTM